MELELRQLWKEERPKVTAAVHEAAKNGDRSENGDYIYGKQRLRQIDSRVRYLNKRLEEVTIVDRLPDNRDKIYFGAQVTLLKNNTEELKLRIVGPDEIDPSKGYISIDSPFAKILIGKEKRQEISFEMEQELSTFEIIAIEYQGG